MPFVRFFLSSLYLLSSPSSSPKARKWESSLTDVAPQEHLEERCYKIVDALHVAGRWVANGPDVKDALERLARGSERIEV